ncbi:MAG: hypothetical protein KCHDKBKB_01062 [Elusimicrobia bacterium]|nr:hypothetical protein [Elusimicrobiota bacterium]
MSLVGKLTHKSGSVKPSAGAGDTRGDLAAPFIPVRTENYTLNPKSKWLVIEPDLFPGEDIVVVLKSEYLAEAEAENPGLVIYTLDEINQLIPHENDVEFRKKIHAAKKTFGGYVRSAEASTASTV